MILAPLKKCQGKFSSCLSRIKPHNNGMINDIANLKKEHDEKIHHLFKDNKAYLEYLLQTKSNFLYRYMETSSDKNIIIQSIDQKTLLAVSYETNMGDAFKTSHNEMKEGIKALAKSVPREDKPRVQYSLKTVLEEFKEDSGKIIIEAMVNWNFPDFEVINGSYKSKRVIFIYNDPNIFRKELALKFEEACELFT